MQPHHGFWVAVRATFTCNACRFDSPLNHFELAEGVRCTRCGLEQRYELSEWRKLVRFAHAVGDFGSGGDEGRFPEPNLPVANPFPKLQHTTWAREGKHHASPGNPLCKSCKGALVVERVDETLTVGCAQCGQSAHYELPATARRIKHLVAVLADEHEAGSREVVIAESTGVVILQCPGCAAPLDDVDDGDGVATCKYCRAVCRISTQSHARAGHNKTPTKTWWLYFNEPSAQRRSLVHDAQQTAAREAKKQHAKEQRALAKAQRAANGGHLPHMPTKADEAKAKQKLAILWGVLGLIMAGFVAWFMRAPTSNASSTAEEELASEEALKKFSFDLSSAEAASLLNANQASDSLTVKLDGKGIVKSAQINRGAPPNPSYGIDLTGGDALDSDAALKRLHEVVPNRVRDAPHSHDVNTARSRLSFDSRVQPQSRGRITVSTWERDDATARTLANAFWSVARYVAYGAPRPSPDALRVVNGSSLADAGGLPLDVRIEGARRSVGQAFPFAGCQSPMADEGSLTCEVDLDHALFHTLRIAWPNGEKATVQNAALLFAQGKQGQVDAAKACLDRALGAGTAVVVDHASGAGKQRWKLGDAEDALILDEGGLWFRAPEERKLTELPAWTEHFAAVVRALVPCKP